jgi:choline dehydrogenase-like flavoprotein
MWIEMLHQIHRRTPPLPPRERATLQALAETALPPGRLMPGADTRTVSKVEAFLAATGEGFARAYRGLLGGLDALARARYLRGFAALPDRRRAALLEWLRGGDYLRRTTLRALLAPVKLAHYEDPAFYRAIGCVWERPAGTPDLPRHVVERTARAADLAGDTLEADVVVVGTGAGGAAAAKELAEVGLAVVLLEEGEYHTRADFGGRAASMQRKLYRDMGATVAVGNTGIPIPVGRAVGGTTTINSGTCYRVPERVLRKWREQLGLADFTPDELARHYERVEAVLEVTRAEPRHLGGVATVIARGCERLGYHKHGPLSRNAPGCDGQGVCCFGCPTDAKRSTNVSYVPLALKAGAQLVTGARVERVLLEGGRAVGVVAGAGDGALTVRARAVVVACGAFYTPLLLERSRVPDPSGQLGKNLSIHPAAAAWAWFDEPMASFSSIPQGYGIEEFHDEGLLFEGGTPPLELGAASMLAFGPRFVELMEAMDRAALMGFMIEDESRGRVRRGPGGRPLITYVLGDRDVARLQRGMDILARVFLAAGARTVVPMVHGFDELRDEADLGRFRAARLTARDFDLSAYHPLGTARIGADRRSSVVGPDHRVHDVPGLYVSDGAAVPSSLAVNPQVTIMALATRAAEHVARALA